MHKNRYPITMLTILMLGLLPVQGRAAGTCAISALDTVAGLGTQVSLKQCTETEGTMLSVSGPSGTVYTQQLVLDSEGSTITLIPSKYTTTAGSYTVTAAGATTTLTVIADHADDRHSLFSASPAGIRAGSNDVVTVTAILRDKYDNPINGRPIALISSRSSDDISALSAQTDEDGRMLWTVRAAEPGTMTLIPYDIVSSKQLSFRADVTVTGRTTLLGSLTGFERGGDVPTNADLTSTVVDHFELELPQNATNVKANELFSMTIRAMNGTTLVRGYVGTLVIESSDSDAELPKKGEDPKSPSTGRVDMRSVDQGERNLSLIFVLRKRGSQTITVYDKLDPSVKGTLMLNVSSSGTDNNESIVIKDPIDRAHIKGPTVKLQGNAPSLVNLKVKGGSQIVDAETDAEGVFRVNVPLNPADKEVTLFVTSENGTMESEPVHLLIDNEAPVIQTVTLDPAEGKTETPATITVMSEPGLTLVTATMNGAPLTFTETEPGRYSSPHVGPKAAGTYDITVTATDSVGNTTTLLTKWTVTSREMPVVTGLAAENLSQQISLRWDAVETLPIAEYKIYIALETDPENYLYSISTKKPVTSAVIKDLPLGKTYQFSITPVSKDGQEGSVKSEPVTASPLGMTLTVKSGRDSVLLEWTTIKDMPLDRYILEFGTQPGEYSEKRSVNGLATSYILRDLLSGVTYELKLTPVTITGKILTDYAAVTRGTPGGKGFTPGASDPVPPDIGGTLHPGANLPPPDMTHVPSTPGSGIPSMATATLLMTALVAGFLWRNYRKQQKLTQEFLSLMQERYHS